MTVEYVKYLRLQFGEYAQVHESHNNMIQSHVTGSIELFPTGSTQEAYYFMSLSNGRRLNLQHFTYLTLMQELIDGVHRLAQHNHSGLDVRDQKRCTFLDVTDDDDGDNSTYKKMDDEINEMDDSDNDPPPGHNATSGAAGVTATDLRNL